MTVEMLTKNDPIIPGDYRSERSRGFFIREDYREIPWNEVVWWNKDLGEMTKERKINDVWSQYLAGGFSLNDGEVITPERLLHSVIERLPANYIAIVDRINKASNNILLANGDAAGIPFMLYNCDEGIWEQEGTSKESVYLKVLYMLENLVGALGNACDLVGDFVKVLAPPPGPRPPASSGRNVHEAWSKASQKNEMYTGEAKRLRGLYDGILSGKLETVIRLLRKILERPVETWDSNMRYIIVGDGAIDLFKIKNYDKQPEIEGLEGKPIDYGIGYLVEDWKPEHYSTVKIKEKLREVSLNYLDFEGYRDREVDGETLWSPGVFRVLPDPEIRTYLQIRFGAALLGTPGVVGKSMVWQYGEPDTAKSSIMECIAGENGVFAPYSLTASGSMLTTKADHNGESERTKAYARGKRFLIMSELDAGSHLSQSTLKTLTGGDTVSGTAKYANSINYQFTATMFMASNDEPVFPPGDVAFKNRIHVVPFTHKLWIKSKDPDKWAAADPDSRADETWKERVLADPMERQAVLLWVLEGLRSFGSRGGLPELPQTMREAGDEFGLASDPVLHAVRSLLGTNEADDFEPAIRLYTDIEWDAMGFVETDGVTVRKFHELLEYRMKQMEYLRPEESVPTKYKTAATKLLNSMGGMKKTITYNNVGGSGRKTSKVGFVRVVLRPEYRDMNHM